MPSQTTKHTDRTTSNQKPSLYYLAVDILVILGLVMIKNDVPALYKVGTVIVAIYFLSRIYNEDNAVFSKDDSLIKKYPFLKTLLVICVCLWVLAAAFGSV